MKIGYIRISTTDQNIARQELLMEQLGGGRGLHRPHERQEYQPPRATKDDGVRSIVEQEDSTLCFENFMQVKTLTIRTEYDIFSIEMSKTSLKTKGRRERKSENHPAKRKSA